jgi:hypothetical protein
MQNFIIAQAKRIADVYDEWVYKGYTDRQQRLKNLLSKIDSEKVREEVRLIVKFRHNE